MPYSLFNRYAGLLACWVLLAGCGGDDDDRPTATIIGQVTLDGAPLSSGSIQFTSPKTGESAYANLDSEGRYRVTFPKADVGSDYDVTVGRAVDENQDPTALAEDMPKPGPNPVPRKYSDRTTSGLKATIANPGENQFDVHLKSR